MVLAWFYFLVCMNYLQLLFVLIILKVWSIVKIFNLLLSFTSSSPFSCDMGGKSSISGDAMGNFFRGINFTLSAIVSSGRNSKY